MQEDFEENYLSDQSFLALLREISSQALVPIGYYVSQRLNSALRSKQSCG
jgi:hypothetical protein